ncbi:hypothetical protein L5515_015558 [Caenorhabditis briggsae]|uniref:One cut domain family member n=1 Tax=Caenorhabditis briggsae TaxID=6238 RepID=A0AAE9EC26_CAEBR|nr:hypothetical protein L5515_015558 [Caenorhabditis briggsae]
MPIIKIITESKTQNTRHDQTVTTVVVGRNEHNQQPVQNSRNENYNREPFQKSTVLKIHQDMIKQRQFQDSFKNNTIDNRYNQPNQNGLDVEYRHVRYHHQPLQTSTNVGSSDDLNISESLIQDYHHGDVNDYQYEPQLLHSSTSRMYNQQPLLSNSDTDDSNDPYTNQPHSSNGKPINPYRQRSFQNGAGFNANSERRQPSHSVESVIKKTDRRKQKSSTDEMTSNKQKNYDQTTVDAAYRRSRGFHGTQSSSSSDSQASSSTSDSETSEYYEARLAAPLKNGAALDTKVLCNSILQELETKKIPQTIFAKRVINRCQGTLSELIRKPKPWDSLKSGHGIYVRLYNWYQLPEEQRMEIVDKKINWSVPAKKENARKRKRTTEGPAPKKARTEFHPVTKNALKTIYDEDPKPSSEMLGIIAETLKLDKRSVTNFFQNTRRRTKYQKDCSRHPVNEYQEENQQGDYY